MILPMTMMVVVVVTGHRFLSHPSQGHWQAAPHPPLLEGGGSWTNLGRRPGHPSRHPVGVYPFAVLIGQLGGRGTFTLCLFAGGYLGPVAVISLPYLFCIRGLRGGGCLLSLG